MTFKISRHARIAFAPAVIGFMAATLLGAGAQAQSPNAATQTYPQIRLAYQDLTLSTSAGRQALVDRVETTATTHCARYGDLIVPYERRGQLRFCRLAVRGEILRAMPPQLRAAYDIGRRDASAAVEMARSE
jgi:UrcA family protein